MLWDCSTFLLGWWYCIGWTVAILLYLRSVLKVLSTWILKSRIDLFFPLMLHITIRMKTFPVHFSVDRQQWQHLQMILIFIPENLCNSLAKFISRPLNHLYIAHHILHIQTFWDIFNSTKITSQDVSINRNTLLFPPKKSIFSKNSFCLCLFLSCQTFPTCRCMPPSNLLLINANHVFTKIEEKSDFMEDSCFWCSIPLQPS
jgi:hypothetical protein